MLFNRFFGRKDSTASKSSTYKINRNNHQPRHMSLEPLESRELLTVTTDAISDTVYDEIRASYPQFELPELQADLNVLTITPEDGRLSLEDLENAIAIAGTSEQPDLILVQTSASANTVTYANSADELTINIDSTQFGFVTIIGWGEEKFTLDANQQSRIMMIEGNSTVVNLGGLKITNGYAEGGGGIANSQSAVTIVNSEISNNSSASSIGGGIANAFGSISIINTEISDNTASRGGGIYNMGTITITNSTIAGNAAEDVDTSEGGGICQYFGTISIYNSVVVCNSANAGTDIYAETAINGSNNLSSYTAWEGSGNLGYNSTLPLFIAAPIGDYRLAPESQAIDQGDNQYAEAAGLDSSSTDLTGAPRISNSTIDLGAHEYHEISAPSAPSFALSVLNPTSVAITVEAVEYASGYTLEYSTSFDFSNSTCVNFSSESEIITDLTPETTYYFRVKVASAYYGVSDFSSAKSVTTPPEDLTDNYNANDVAKLRSFLEQTNSDDVKNGTLINSEYNSNNPATWTGVTWEEVDGIMFLSSINWEREDLELVGDLDVSGCTALQTLNCNNCQGLVSLNASGCSSLQELNCEDNQLTSLNVSGCTALESLNCKSNELTVLDVSKNTALKSLDCYYNQLITLDVSKNTALTSLRCHGNSLASLDVSKNTALTTLECSACDLTSLDVSQNTALTTLNCSQNQLASLDASNNVLLTSLQCYNNQLVSLDVSDNTALTQLDCSQNQLTSLDVSNNVLLTSLQCYNNQITLLNVSKNANLTTLNCFDGTITNIILPLDRSNGIVFESRFVVEEDPENPGELIETEELEWTLCNMNGSALSTGNTVTPSTALPIYARNHDNSRTILIESVLLAPTLSAETTGFDSVEVTIEAVDNVSRYTLEYSTSADFANVTSQNVSAGVTSVSGLTADTTYYFRAKAISEAYAYSDYSAVVSATTESAPKLYPPTITQALATDQNTISVKLTYRSNAGSYRLQYSTNGETWSSPIVVEQTTGAAPTYQFTNLYENTTYYFRARSIIADGDVEHNNSDWTEIVSATTPATPVTPEVNAIVVFQNSLTTVDVSEEQPVGISSIRAGSTVYADIWIKDIEYSDPAIAGGYLNMAFENAALTVEDVTYGSVFSLMTGYQQYGDGVVTTIGGITEAGILDKGDDEWVRLATVCFVAQTEGVTTVSLQAPENNLDNLTRVDGIILSNGQINYGSAELEISAACPMDIDGDGYIGVSDFTYLSRAWRTKPGNENWNPACDIDGDNYVGVSDFTYLSRNWRKYTTDPTLVYPTVNASPAAVASEDIIDSLDQLVLEASETAIICQTAAPTSTEQINPGASAVDIAFSAAVPQVAGKESGNSELTDSQEESPLAAVNFPLTVENKVESSMTLLESYSAALLDLYDNQDSADLSGVSDALAESRMDDLTENYSEVDSQKASSDAIDAVLEELLTIDWEK